MNPRIVIIGAGPTGLGAGYRLAELGHQNFQLYDRNPYLGGLAGSFTDPQGFTWDIGGHVMFSHYDYYDRVFEDLVGDEYQLNQRESWVRICGTWVPYPFQNNIRYLPPEVCHECLIGLIRAQTEGRAAGAANCAEFMAGVFGEGIWRIFMEPYNFKVWAHKPEMMSKEWLGERVAVIDIERSLRNVVLQQDDFGWGPNNLFKFPLHGGTGDFYRRFDKPLAGHLTLDAELVEVDLAARRLSFADGRTDTYDVLINTIPVDRFVGLLRGEVPRRVRQAAGRLSHSGGHMVGVGIERPCPSTRSWMYFPESDCPFYRVTYLSNYSPHMTPDNDRYFSLLCETSYSEHKPEDASTIVDRTIQGLINTGLLEEADRDRIASVWHYDADYSYPVPTLERDGALADLLPFLEHHQILSRGRFGIWKYEVANTDHSLMQGVEAVNRLLQGEPETTIGVHYETEKAGLSSARSVRPSVAGSGDPGRYKPNRQAEHDIAGDELAVSPPAE